jgi:hypothetical protein
MGRICCACSQATAVSAVAVELRRTDMAQSSLDGEPSCCREACSRRFELQKVARRRGEESQDLQPARSESRIEQNMGSHGVGGRQRRQQGDSTSPTLDTAGNSDAIIPLVVDAQPAHRGVEMDVGRGGDRRSRTGVAFPVTPQRVAPSACTEKNQQIQIQMTLYRPKNTPSKPDTNYCWPLSNAMDNREPVHEQGLRSKQPRLS